MTGNVDDNAYIRIIADIYSCIHIRNLCFTDLRIGIKPCSRSVYVITTLFYFTKEDLFILINMHPLFLDSIK